MKKISLLFFISFFGLAAQAQTDSTLSDMDDEEYGFNWNRVFVGGGLNFTAGTGRIGFGLLPEVGYSLADWIDVGIVINFNYASIKFKDAYNYYKQKNTIAGVGSFLRVYPIPNVFINIQPELNWTTIKQTKEGSSQTLTYKYNSTSVLGGIGYAQRIMGENNFYIMLALDLMQEINSPYRDHTNNAIIQYRSGFNFYLGKKKRNYSRR